MPERDMLMAAVRQGIAVREWWMHARYGRRTSHAYFPGDRAAVKLIVNNGGANSAMIVGLVLSRRPLEKTLTSQLAGSSRALQWSNNVNASSRSLQCQSVRLQLLLL